MSKGVKLHTFSTDGFSVEHSRFYDGEWEKNKVDSGHNQISEYHVELYKRYGITFPDNDELRIRPQINGNTIDTWKLEISGGDFTDKHRKALLRPSIVEPNYCISFGLYTKKDQVSWSSIIPIVAIAKIVAAQASEIEYTHVYMAITGNQSDWMKRLFAEMEKRNGLTTSDFKLENLVLPGSHDSGMFLPIPGSIAIFANTQKDEIATQLALGARTFDLRPTRFNPEKPNKPQKAIDIIKAMGLPIPDGKNVYSVHGIIPGVPYQKMLDEIVDFLAVNTEEIVTIIIDDGSVQNDIRMSGDDPRDVAAMENTLDRALARHPGMRSGDKSSLKKSIATLLANNERLIILYKDNGFYGKDDPRGISSIKSWKGSLAESSKPENAKKALEEINKLNVSEWDECDLVDIGLQLTPINTSDISNIVSSAASIVDFGADHDQSPLRGVKPQCDKLTYEWLKSDNLKPESLSTLISIANDFYDPGLTSIVYDMNVKRLGRLADQ